MLEALVRHVTAFSQAASRNFEETCAPGTVIVEPDCDDGIASQPCSLARCDLGSNQSCFATPSTH